MSDVTQPQWITGFWRRVGAFFIDSLLLGLLGFILGLAFESTFVEIGSWGRLVGFSIALIYFSIMNSNVGNGQTIGKKLLKLRVVNSDNQTIGLGRSIVRYVVFATPFSLNGAHLTNEAMFSWLMYPVSLVLFGGIFSILYLYVFNRVTRQSLHDLAVGSYVVNAGVEKQEVGSVWNVHLIIVVLLFFISAIAPVFTSKLAQTEPFKEMLMVQAALSSEPEVTYSTISTSVSVFSSINEGTKGTSYVSAQAFLSSNKVSDSDLARRLAEIIVINYPEARKKDTLIVSLTYGYDIGIWALWFNQTHDFSPDEFQEDAPSRDAILEKADEIVTLAHKDNVSASKDARYVFDAANLLHEEKFFDKAAGYYQTGLQLSPWNMNQQLQYAKLLFSTNKPDKAKSIAEMVLVTSENGELIKESALMTGRSLPSSIKYPSEIASNGKVIHLVRMGNVEDWILQKSGQMLSEKLATPVYVEEREFPLLEPDRIAGYKIVQRFSDNIMWDHPAVIEQMESLNIASKDVATPNEIFEINARIFGGQNNYELVKQVRDIEKSIIDMEPQWDEDPLLKLLIKNFPDTENTVYIGITDKDLYSKDNNYIFGMAHRGDGYAVVSYKRFLASFNNEKESQSRLINRLHKQLLSSTGFTLGIPRPTDPRSARSYPNSLSDHDLKGTWLSEECIDGFEKALGHPLPEKTIEESRLKINY
jgi:predicted Zn-dependent protease/uncharacterized RDD family membrane protein YckC